MSSDWVLEMPKICFFNVFCCRGPQGGLAQKLKREQEPEPGTSTLTSTSTSTSSSTINKRRKTGDKKVKVPASMGVAPCGQPAPPVDHLKLLLNERVYHAENQATAINSLIDEIVRNTVAWNSREFNLPPPPPPI